MLGLMALGAASLLKLWPFPELDTGRLYIVETLAVEPDPAGVRLRAGESAGTGPDLIAAAEDLGRQTPGELFLRQTGRVIFCGGTEKTCDLRELNDLLPMGVCLYRCRTLPEDQETLNKRLEVRERQRKDAPTLARAENRLLLGRDPGLAELEAEHGA